MTIAKINKALGPPPRTRTPTEPPPTDLPAAGDHPTTPKADPARLPTATDRVKLPKISLPHFRGDLLRWTAFWDSFESAVHSKRPSLRD